MMTWLHKSYRSIQKCSFICELFYIRSLKLKKKLNKLETPEFEIFVTQDTQLLLPKKLITSNSLN